ncbi:MAG: hypothetical protein QOD77_102 [Thermoplasmata archaeon]|jgi:hypothetical protein|nr:hypothetical protein [Thermoplasmata archaeon]
MQPNLHAHNKEDWMRLHVDEDLDRWVGRLADGNHHADPEPVLSEV